MRTATAGELTVLESGHPTHYIKVEAKNGSGTWKDLTSLSSANYLFGATIEEDIDQFCAQLTVRAKRDAGAADPTLSLSPLKEDSTLNRLDDGTTYSPLLDIYREIRLYAAVVAFGASPSGSDWKLKFHGRIDAIDWDHDPVVITARDQGGRLLDDWIESPASYGNGADSLATVVQAILTAEVSSPPTLYEPSASGHAPLARTVDVASVYDAIKALVDEIGWDLRFRFREASGAYELTLSAPRRTETTADYTWAPSKYIDVEKLTLEGAEIRNRVKVSYGTASPRASTTRTDGTSETRWGPRFMEIVEPRITSSTIAETLGDRVVLDLKDPKAEIAIRTFFDWRIELGDYLGFSNNNIHFDTTQKVGVTSIRHEWEGGTGYTTIFCAGQPKGQYLNWLNRGTAADTETIARTPFARVGFVSGNTTSETVSYTGTLAPNGVGPISMRRRIDVGDSAGSYGAAAATIANEAITRDKTYPKVVTLEVTDSATGMMTIATHTVAAEVPMIDRATGKHDPGVPDKNGNYAAMGDSAQRIKNEHYLPMLAVGGLGSYNTGSLTGVDTGGGTAKITVGNHSLLYGESLSVAYTGGDITGLANATTYYVYTDDPTFAGGAVTWAATTTTANLFQNAGANGRRFVGRVTTPAGGAGNTSGSGGGGGVVVEAL